MDDEIRLISSENQKLLNFRTKTINLINKIYGFLTNSIQPRATKFINRYFKEEIIKTDDNIIRISQNQIDHIEPILKIKNDPLDQPCVDESEIQEVDLVEDVKSFYVGELKI